MISKHNYNKNLVIRLGSFIDRETPFYLVNTRMRTKRDIRRGQLCTPGGGGGEYSSEFSVGLCRPVL